LHGRNRAAAAAARELHEIPRIPKPGRKKNRRDEEINFSPDLKRKNAIFFLLVVVLLLVVVVVVQSLSRNTRNTFLGRPSHFQRECGRRVAMQKCAGKNNKMQ